MTIIGLIGLTILACQSNKDGYTIKGDIEGAGQFPSGEKKSQPGTR